MTLFIYFLAILSSVIVVLFLPIAFIRNEVAYQNRSKILDAIYLYQLDLLDTGKVSQVDYEDMESYDRTVFRIFDFGCRHILPEEKFALIEPYLGKEVKEVG